MANSFSKEEIVYFEKVLEGFQDAMVISKAVKKFPLDDVTAERTGNTVWVPQPYIAQSFTGIDQTSNFNRNYAQLSVPITLGYNHAAPFTLSATELRDALQQERLKSAAMQKLASDINIDCSNLAALQGTVVVKRTVAASGFDDVAAIDTIMNEQGVPMTDRKAFFSSTDYNAMASNLAARQTVQGKVQNAYEKAYIGDVAGFDAYKLDYAYRLTAAVATTVTITNATPLFYTPAATVASVDGLTRNNVDNRYQTITLNVAGTPGIKAGDAFTIAGVNASHHITKADTGRLKTFRIISQASGTAGQTGTYVISPPIISGGGGTDPELQYKNVAAAPTNGAAITFLNTVSAPADPFWQEDAIVLAPGHYRPASDSGLAMMSASTDNGISVLMTRQGSILDLSTKYRFDVFYGLSMLQPEMAGIEIFNQT